ncbi:hypothetical protein ALC60_14341 [Trachymyrmex zeteki]|uniref:Uncharacterized protein n=1 Tax=Mycetomoellerius zeteki TaxID=64791 RepID=A0A151WFI8_9HYME|nr:hypothetical protein ALC60_14341 [Trachymyrmex zeteki]
MVGNAFKWRETVHSILFSSPIPKRKDRLEKYSNPGIGDTVKRFHGAELCQSSRRTATRASSTFWITPANSTRDSQRNSSTGIQDIQSCCKEEQLLWSKSLSPSSSSFSLFCTTTIVITLLRSLYFTTLPRASITPTSRTERTRLLLVELLLWTNPREFTRSRRYPKYRRNNPPFRFNLLHFARIPRRTVMTHHRRYEN